MKIRPVGAELLHSDGRTNIRTDRHEKANNAFRNFGSASKTHDKKKPCKGILCIRNIELFKERHLPYPE